MPDRPLDDHRLRRLIAAGRELVQEHDTEALLDEILATAQEVTGARYAALGVLDAEGRSLERFVTRGLPDAERARIARLPSGKGVLGALIAHPVPLRLDRLGEDPRAHGFPANHPPMTSFLGVPVVMRGRVWGNVYLTEKRAGPFDAADEEALVILADWAAVALENARLYEELRGRHEQDRRVNRRLAATTEIARAVGTETELERVLELIVQRGLTLLEARAMVVLVADGGGLTVAAGAGELGDLARGARVPLHGSAVGQAFLRQEARVLPATARQRWTERFGVPTRSSVLLAPLVFRDRSVGVLAAVDPAGDRAAVSDQEQELVLAVAASAATAVATAQTVGEQRMRDVFDGAEAERRRWARELHDDTLQGLAGLHVRLATALRHAGAEATPEPGADAASGDDEPTGDSAPSAARGEAGATTATLPLATAVREVVAQVDEEIRRLRALITELRPAALDELGLGPALGTLGAEVGASSGIAVDVDVDLGDAAGRLDAQSETAVYRIVQESLTNIVKHAGAGRAVVEVACEAETVDVRVRDDGVGIAAGEADGRGPGFGLLGMRERVRLAGGSLAVEPGSYGGTVVRARIPVSTAPR